VKHYFETVDHEILLKTIEKKIKDKNILWLIKIILENHKTKIKSKGMPLGNLTSQFFANVYLNELDYYVKEHLKIKYYIRYVDDFAILSDSEKTLSKYRFLIDGFLRENLYLELHPEKTQISNVGRGTTFLGLRVFLRHKLLAKRNIRKFKNKINKLCWQYDAKEIDYDKIYDVIEGWTAYGKTANTYSLRTEILLPLENKFINNLSTKEYHRRHDTNN